MAERIVLEEFTGIVEKVENNYVFITLRDKGERVSYTSLDIRTLDFDAQEGSSLSFKIYADETGKLTSEFVKIQKHKLTTEDCKRINETLDKLLPDNILKDDDLLE